MPYFYIPSRRIRIEFLSFFVCFLIAVGLNVYAIIHYNGELSELWTSLLYVLEATVMLYAVWIILRQLIYGIRCLIGLKPKSKNRHAHVIHRHQRGYRHKHNEGHHHHHHHHHDSE